MDFTMGIGISSSLENVGFIGDPTNFILHLYIN